MEIFYLLTFYKNYLYVYNFQAGLQLVSLIDNGETVGLHGLRTSPRHQGKGIVKIMFDKIMKDLVFSGTANRWVTCLDGVTSKIHAKSSIVGQSTMIMERVRVKHRYEILNLNK